FRQGYEEGVTRIELPDVAELSKLRTLAMQGSVAFTSSTAGSDGQATMRIEFVTIEVNGVNEGFFKVYRSNSYNSAGARWVVAGREATPANTPNCGHRHTIDGKQYFYSALRRPSGQDIKSQTLGSSADRVMRGNNPSGHSTHAARCYLGGSDSLSVDLSFRASDGRG